jgi:hypothetical protein
MHHPVFLLLPSCVPCDPFRAKALQIATEPLNLRQLIPDVVAQSLPFLV